MDSLNSTLISISTKLLDSPTSEMDRVIIECLQSCRQALGVDRISCLPIENVTLKDWRSYEARGENIPKVSHNVPADVILAYRRFINAGVVESSDTNPELLKLCSQLQDEQPVRHILVPIRAMGQPWGLMACANFTTIAPLHDDFVATATMLGNIIASSIERVVHYERLIQSQNEVIERNKRIVGEQERERKNIARDLHDDFSQRLASLGIELGFACNTCDVQSRPVIEKCANDLAQITKDIQQLSRHLHPVVIERVGLCSAIQSHAEQVTERTGLQLLIELDNDIRFDHETSLHIYRIVQEALSNVVKHANASAVTITMQRSNDGAVVLCVRDDGIGITERRKTQSSLSLGIQSMIERAELAGGNLAVTTHPPKAGTSVTLSLAENEVQSRWQT